MQRKENHTVCEIHLQEKRAVDFFGTARINIQQCGGGVLRRSATAGLQKKQEHAFSESSRGRHCAPDDLPGATESDVLISVWSHRALSELS